MDIEYELGSLKTSVESIETQIRNETYGPAKVTAKAMKARLQKLPRAQETLDAVDLLINNIGKVSKDQLLVFVKQVKKALKSLADASQ